MLKIEESETGEPIEMNVELRAKIGMLIMEEIDSPEKMDRLPSVVVTLIATAVGTLMAGGAEEEVIQRFVAEVIKGVYENELPRVQAAREVAEAFRDFNDTEEG